MQRITSIAVAFAALFATPLHAADTWPVKPVRMITPYVAGGNADIQARYTLETDAGARILVSSDGLRHGPPDVMAKLARGDSVDPALYYFRTLMRFETSDPSVDWLNRILALARGQREARAVRLDVYEVE